MAKKKTVVDATTPEIPLTFLDATDSRIKAIDLRVRQEEARGLALSIDHWIRASSAEYLGVNGLVDRDVAVAAMGDALGHMMKDMPRFIVDEFIRLLSKSIRDSFEEYNKPPETKKAPTGAIIQA